MENVKELIIQALKKGVMELTGLEVNPQLEHATDEKHGDYSTNVAMALFRDKGLSIKDEKHRTPLGLAQKIAEELNNSSFILNHCSLVEAVAPGFINFSLSKEYLVYNLNNIIDKGDKYGYKDKDSLKKVVVEYSSPNIAKPFTIGHLRSTIIGDAVANLLEANGWTVYRDNHLGDWGTQFGKQIYAIKEWGDEEQIEKSKKPIEMLVSLYVKFHKEAENKEEIEEKGREWFKKLEDGDRQARRLWKKCVEWSLKEFKRIYDILGIHFTENNGLGYGESFFEDKMDDVIEELDKKGLLRESKGAKLVFFPKDKYPPLMIVKKDGTTLYGTRDLATDKFRLNKYGKDVVIINEVGIEQSLYFKQLFEVEKMLGWVKEGQRIHFKHGHFRFKDKKMSTRKGDVVWLEEVLGEAIRRAQKLASESSRKTASDVGIGALKWNDLKRSPHLDIVFDWDEILNMEGNSGPYLQYTFARTQSVLRKSEILKISRGRRTEDEVPSDLSFRHQSSVFSLLSSDFDIRYSNLDMKDEEKSILRVIHRFPEVVEESADRYTPNILCNYLFDLAQKFNLFYQRVRILKIPQDVIASPSADGRGDPNRGKIASKASPDRNDIQEFRLALAIAVGRVIKNGLSLLGIQAPEKM